MKLAIVGGTVVDFIFPRTPRLPAWPRHTEFTSDNLVQLREAPIVSLGGNGANAAFVAARCGAEVSLYTQIGEDALGGLARRWLESSGCEVQTSGNSVATAVNVTATKLRHERATFFYPGAPVSMPSLSNQSFTHLLVCGWPHPPLSLVAKKLAACRKRNQFTALDVGPILGPAWTLSELAPVLRLLDLVLGNEYELRQITRSRSLAAAFTKLRREFSGHVVIKRGGQGVAWVPAGLSEPRYFPAHRVRIINTVGAGDSFNGALLAALTQGAEFPAAIRQGCATAASVVRSPSGVLGVRPAKGSCPLKKLPH